MRWMLIAVGALFLGAIVGVAIATAPASGAGAVASREAIAAARRPADLPPPHPLPAARPDATVVPPPPAAPPTPPGASPASDEANDAASTDLPKDPAGRRQALEPLRGEIYGALNGFRWRVGECQVVGATLFVTIETLDAAVRIADVRLEPVPTSEEPRGGSTTADERSVRCVRGALVGNVIGAPSATPGRRWEMPFDVGRPD